MSADDTPTGSSGIDRREALKRAAQVAGVAAFATPVVAGVFRAPAMAQTLCDVEGDSDLVEAEVSSGSIWNQNCGGQGSGVNGRYNGQNHTVSIAGGTGIVQVGNAGNDNFDTNVSFYVVIAQGFLCDATFVYVGCGTVANPVPTLLSTPIAGAPAAAQPVPFCPGACPPISNAPNGILVLESVTCCPG